MISLDGKYVTEIEKRIGIAKEVFDKMNAVFKNRQLKVKTRMRVLTCCVLSVLLFGCDAWTIGESIEEVLNQWKCDLTLHINFTDSF